MVLDLRILKSFLIKIMSKEYATPFFLIIIMYIPYFLENDALLKRTVIYQEYEISCIIIYFTVNILIQYRVGQDMAGQWPKS
jgi:hypothetical protein